MTWLATLVEVEGAVIATVAKCVCGGGEWLFTGDRVRWSGE